MKKTRKMQEWLNLFLIGTYAISMILSFVLYGGIDGNFRKAYEIGLFSCVFLFPLWLFLRKVEWELEEPGRVLFFGLLFFGLAAILVMISIHINTCFLWIGGCILLSALFPTGIGIGFFLFFGCLFCFINNATISYEIFMFLLGIVLCGSVSLLKRGKPVFLVILIDLIIYTLLFFVLTQGSHAYFEWPSMIAMAGHIVFLTIAKRFYVFFKKTSSLFEDWWEV